MLSPSTSGFAGTSGGGELSPAEQHALRRSAPLTATEFKAVGELVDSGRLPLRRLLPRSDNAR